MEIPIGKLDEKELNRLYEIRKERMSLLIAEGKSKSDLLRYNFPQTFIDKYFDEISKSIKKC